MFLKDAVSVFSLFSCHQTITDSTNAVSDYVPDSVTSLKPTRKFLTS